MSPSIHLSFQSLPHIYALLSLLLPVSGWVVFVQLWWSLQRQLQTLGWMSLTSWTSLKGWERSNLFSIRSHSLNTCVQSENLDVTWLDMKEIIWYNLFWGLGWDGHPVWEPGYLTLTNLSVKNMMHFGKKKIITVYLIGLSWLIWSCANSL